MFTGIIEEVGVVEALEPRLRIRCRTVTEDARPGASIAVNGVCLTVAEFAPGWFAADVAPETLSRSNLGDLRPGALVNLERALTASGRLGGHIVQGHVDGQARVRRIERSAGGRVWTFTAADDLMPFIIPAGSIAVDGVSLTVAKVEGSTFSVALIPVTLERTTLGELRVGDAVNIETDIIARTVVAGLRRMSSQGAAGPLTVDMLHEQGW